MDPWYKIAAPRKEVREGRSLNLGSVVTRRDHSPDSLRHANALSALYSKNSEEKRLLDAMLLAVPR